MTALHLLAATAPVHELVLAAIILAAYAGAMVWALRGESRRTIAGLLALVLATCALRTVFLHQYPIAYAEDELKAYESSVSQSDPHWPGRVWLACTYQDESALLYTLSEGLPSRFGVGQFWAIRGYTLILSCLCVPLAYSVLRRVTTHRTSAWFSAASFVVLPWAILYGRVNQGGEYVFHELLALLAVVALLFTGAWVAPLLIGTFAVTLCLYSCPPIRIYWHLIAAYAVLFGPFRVRATLCGIALCSLLLYAPALLYPPCSTSRCGFGQCNTFAQGLLQGSLTAVRKRLADLPRCLTTSNGCENNQSHAIDSAGQHPLWLFALATAGLLAGSRRLGLMLATAAVVTPLPAIISWHGVSAHELLTWFPLIPISAAVALDRFPMPKPLRPVVVAVLTLLLTVWSVPRYFSSAFWTPPGQWVFNFCHRMHGDGTSADYCQY